LEQTLGFWRHWPNRKYQKDDAIFRTVQSDVMIFFNAIYNNEIRQYLQIAAGLIA